MRKCLLYVAIEYDTLKLFMQKWQLFSKTVFEKKKEKKKH